MNGKSGGIQRWTQRFTVASAVAFVIACAAAGVTSDLEIPGVLVVFGFVCPMIFGMGYLLLPPYVRRTLIDDRLPGIHFCLAFSGAGLLILGTALDGAGLLVSIGVTLWSLGVVVFVGALLATVGPAVLDDPSIIFRFGDRSQRSTRLATAAIPVAIGYLVLGTIVLVHSTGTIGSDTSSLAATIHLYAAGFGAVLIFSLGARLLVGFFRVNQPKPLLWVVLITGAFAPALLGLYLWVDPWFSIGAILESIAMVGYGVVVAIAGYRTERRRVGYTGIALGAVAGVVAIVLAALVAVETPLLVATVSVHRTAILWGFFPLTIVGYAFLFFPVADGQVPGATPRVARAAIVALAVGLLLRLAGIVGPSIYLRIGGVAISSAGAVLYCYLVTRRFYR
jgi:hypothetical protein